MRPSLTIAVSPAKVAPERSTTVSCTAKMLKVLRQDSTPINQSKGECYDCNKRTIGGYVRYCPIIENHRRNSGQSPGENVGKIHEVVIDANKNRVAYVVLSFGGFLGMGNKLFAIPWEAFEFSVSENKFILNVDKEKLMVAPGFEESDKWPDFLRHSLGKDIYKYYDFAPPWKYDNDPGNMSIKPEYLRIWQSGKYIFVIK